MGIISAAFGKDPTDPRWRDDPNTKGVPGLAAKILSGRQGKRHLHRRRLCLLSAARRMCSSNVATISPVRNIMRQTTNLHNVAMPWLLPGVTLNTSPTDYQPIKEMREIRFNGKSWELLDESN